MRRPSWIMKSGPFKCESYVNGYVLVKPSWEQYGDVWEMQAGGGPGVFGRMGLAGDLEKWLNSVYTPEQMEHAAERIALHDRNLKEQDTLLNRKLHGREYWLEEGGEV